MSNHYTSGSHNNNGGGHSFSSRREMRNNNVTGALPPLRSPDIEYAGSFDFEGMLTSLRELFEQDRQIASQPDATRCGICYLHFHVDELHYREEEGFYACPQCEQALGKHTLRMLRVQQKM